MNILEIRGVGKSFDGKPILRDINLALDRGEIISLLGVSGVGKTTLFNIIAGLTAPDEGTVVLGGEDITCRPGHISYMLQKDLLLPHKTVLDNVALPLVIRGVKKSVAREEAAVHFDKFGLAGYEKKYPHELSGGMRQRAALLRTYLFSEDVALLDEPFSALDTITKGELHEWYLSVMQEIRLSTIFVTHDIDEAILLSDRVCILGCSDDLPDRGATITHEIKIENRKEKNNDYLLSEDFLSYKKMISDFILLRMS